MAPDSIPQWITAADYSDRDNLDSLPFVRQGEILGLVGDTGKLVKENGGDGSHIHLTVGADTVFWGGSVFIADGSLTTNSTSPVNFAEVPGAEASQNTIVSPGHLIKPGANRDGANTLIGTAGADTLDGGADNDSLDGADSDGDVALFSGGAANYRVRRNPDLTVLEGPDGKDSLRGIEILRFDTGPDLLLSNLDIGVDVSAADAIAKQTASIEDVEFTNPGGGFFTFLPKIVSAIGSLPSDIKNFVGSSLDWLLGLKIVKKAEAYTISSGGNAPALDITVKNVAGVQVSGGEVVTEAQLRALTQDDFGETNATAGVLSATPLGGATSVKGLIERAWDEDRFLVELSGGQRYAFTAMADSARLDPFLRLLDGTGQQVAFSDNLAPGTTSAFIGFTAPTAGSYWLQGGGQGGSLGSYSLLGSRISPTAATPATPVIPSEAAAPTSFTIWGTSGKDSIIGTAASESGRVFDGSDTVYMEGGNDSMLGDSGNDRLYGGDGNDLLLGGDDDDNLLGGNGRDSLHGEAGDDDLNGNAAADYLHGWIGHDTLFGNDGDDTARGGTGDDYISAGAGNDAVWADEDRDEVRGGTGADYLNGGAGSDTLDGGSDNDRLVGEGGADFIEGGDGDDTLDGGDAADTLEGGLGSDRLDGGAGSNWISMDEVEGAYVNVFDGVAISPDGDDRFDNIANVLGSGFDDRIEGNHDANVLVGDSGNDSIRGHNHNDTISGGSGLDTLWGDEGDDTVAGDGGDDELRGGLGADTLNGGVGNDHLRGEQGDDLLDGGDGINSVFFWGERDDFLIRMLPDGAFEVLDLRPDGQEGRDIVRNVADFMFFDGVVPAADILSVAPAATADRFVLREGQAAVLPVLVNDIDTDGDALSIIGVEGEGAFIFGGDLFFDAGAAGFDALKPGESLTVPLTYTVTDGNGWRTSGSVEVVVNGAAETPGWVGGASAPPVLGVRNDFTADGRSDALIRHQDGTIGLWTMNGPAISIGTIVANPGPTWNAEGCGDFDGDGQQEILVRRHDGTVGIWDMNGTSLVSGSVIASPGAGWKVVAIGDFDDDGTSDVVVRNDDGSVGLWDMAGGTIANGVILANPGTAWEVVGTGQFQGDGSSDIVVRHEDGRVGIWWIQNNAIVAGEVVATPSADWQVVGIGDVNNDGVSDIVVRHDDGTVGFWRMNGAEIAEGRIIASPLAAWKVANVANYDGDGDADIMVRADDGTVGVWVLDAGTLIGGHVVANPGTDWSVIG